MNDSFDVDDSLKIPPDPILGLSKLFSEDKRKNKIDAGIGVFRDENGKTFTPDAIKLAYKSLDIGLGDYLNPTGEEEYLGDRTFLIESSKLVFGKSNLNFASAGTPGGTGGVALAFDLFKALFPNSPIVLGVPTWINHLQIAKSRKIEVLTFAHIRENKFDIDGQIKAIKNSPKNSLVVFHCGKTHNPTGSNPSSKKEWQSLAKVMENRIAFFDAPYAGFGDGLTEDLEPIRIFMNQGVNLSAAISFAKNGGIYKERPGVLFIPASSKKQALELQRLMNSIARVAYSSPPALGERLIAKVLSTPKLFKLWTIELAMSAEILKQRREILSKEIPEFYFVKDQVGLFSILPLTEKQVEKLRKEHGIYLSLSGRVNFGGITKSDMKRFANAIKNIL